MYVGKLFCWLIAAYRSVAFSAKHNLAVVVHELTTKIEALTAKVNQTPTETPVGAPLDASGWFEIAMRQAGELGALKARVELVEEKTKTLIRVG